VASSQISELQQHLYNSHLSMTIWVSRYQKGETSPDLLEQEIVSGNGISWAICKSAFHRHSVCNLRVLGPVFLHFILLKNK